jgi:magnesium-transporting ATPase (P-type)
MMRARTFATERPPLLACAAAAGTRQTKASNAAAKLRAMLSVKATVLRGGIAQEVEVSHLVPGDVGSPRRAT